MADIIEDKSEEVLGALYVISQEELEILDRLEGYPDLYDRINVEVFDGKGNTYEAFAYIMTEKELTSDDFINTIIDYYQYQINANRYTIKDSMSKDAGSKKE